MRDCRVPTGTVVDAAATQAIFTRTRDAAYHIIKRKHSTYDAIGIALLAIVEAILRDQRTVLTVGVPMRGEYGVEGMAMSLPDVVGRKGAEEVLTIAMRDDEVRAFQRSAQALEDHLAELG